MKSPNFGKRRNGLRPELVVLHYTAMRDCASAARALCDPVREVSAHYLISEQGQVWQLVSEDQRAWHAGVSEYVGRTKCNDFSIGVEVEGCDDVPYTFAQYRALAQLSTRIMEQYPAITASRITGHENIAPGRKTDPGPAFDWAFFHEMLAAFQDGQKVQNT